MLSARRLLQRPPKNVRANDTARARSPPASARALDGLPKRHDSQIQPRPSIGGRRYTLSFAKLFEGPLRVDSEYDRDAVDDGLESWTTNAQGKRPCQARLEPPCRQRCAFDFHNRRLASFRN